MRIKSIFVEEEGRLKSGMCESAHLVHHRGHNRRASKNNNKHKVKRYAPFKTPQGSKFKRFHQVLLL